MATRVKKQRRVDRRAANESRAVKARGRQADIANMKSSVANVRRGVAGGQSYKRTNPNKVGGNVSALNNQKRSRGRVNDPAVAQVRAESSQRMRNQNAARAAKKKVISDRAVSSGGDVGKKGFVKNAMAGMAKRPKTTMVFGAAIAGGAAFAAYRSVQRTGRDINQSMGNPASQITSWTTYNRTNRGY